MKDRKKSIAAMTIGLGHVPKVMDIFDDLNTSYIVVIPDSIDEFDLYEALSFGLGL